MRTKEPIIMDDWEKAVRENGVKFTDTLVEPLKWIANELLEGNIKIWLKDPTHWDLIGAESVRMSGFTTNQKNWLMKLDRTIKSYKRKSCEGCSKWGDSWIDDLACNVCMQETMRGTANHPKYKKG